MKKEGTTKLRVGNQLIFNRVTALINSPRHESTTKKAKTWGHPIGSKPGGKSREPHEKQSSKGGEGPVNGGCVPKQAAHNGFGQGKMEKKKTLECRGRQEGGDIRERKQRKRILKTKGRL